MAQAKYLTHYAEAESQNLDNFPFSYDHCIAIPMYRESKQALNYFCQFAEQQQNTLLIVIINRPDSDADQQWAQTILQQLPKARWQSPCKQTSLHPLQQQSGLLIVDRCCKGPAIPRKQGVGLARKIINDIACQLINQQRIKYPWIFNTDADAKLPSDYFKALTKAGPSTTAIIYPYLHVNEKGGSPHIATQLYELSLNYYVTALKWADSQYGYQTLGSIIAVKADSYAKVRGFPKRAAAEDFYLLNKLAKTGDILSLSQPCIKLNCRQSNRVPFGTGPAVTRIIEQGNYNEMPFYAPIIFHYLKAFNYIINQCAVSNNLLDIINITDRPGIKQQLLLDAANHLKLPLALTHAHQQGDTIEKRLRHIHTWFDAFKTLKFLHYVRDQKYPMMSYRDWQHSVANEPYSENLELPYHIE